MTRDTRGLWFLAAALAMPGASVPAVSADADWRAPAAAEWPMAGGDWGNTRYSTLAQIDARNVQRLGGTWRLDLGAETSRSTPVVHEGLMFLTAGAHVYALDPGTGAVVWKHRPEVPPAGLYKGVAVGEGLVFVGLSDSSIVALQQKTGEKVWRALVGDPVAGRADLEKLGAGLGSTGQFISAAPTYARGLVVSGMANGDFEIRGRVVAFDAKTGRQAWRFDTVPAPGEPGHETWPKDNEAWKIGGGGVWMTPVIDPDLGLVYFGVGNPVPGWGGEARAGDNLFTDAVVALDLRTGRRRWHHQLVRHDVWEHDLGTPLMLYEARFGGRMRKALGVMRTDGQYFVLDRTSGKPLLPIEERPVPQNAALRTAPTQPFPAGGDAIGPRCAERELMPPGFEPACYFDTVMFEKPNVMFPLLTTRASPMAWSPRTGYLYVAGRVAPQWVRRVADPYFFFAPGSVPGMKGYGLLTALDGRTGRIAWQKRTPYQIHNGSGALATAGGLMFHGEPDGHFQAYDAGSGELLWQFQTGFPAEGAAVSYAAAGEQYLALVATRAVWAFCLGGSLAPLPAPPAPPTETGFAGLIEDVDRIEVAAPLRDMGIGREKREVLDEYRFRPVRARIVAGAPVVWTNNGHETHTIVAMDGSWRTEPIAPGASASLTFARPGRHTYICKEHPWSYGQLIVE